MPPKPPLSHHKENTNKMSEVVEGKATIRCKEGDSIFYNPVQKFNRDLTVTVLRQFVDSREARRGDSQDDKQVISLPPRKRAKVANGRAEEVRLAIASIIHNYDR